MDFILYQPLVDESASIFFRVLFSLRNAKWGHIDPRVLGHCFLWVNLCGDGIVGMERDFLSPLSYLMI